MEQRQREYVEYYRVRYRKVQDSSLYPHTAQAELEMLRAIESAPSLEAFGDLVRERALNVKVAVARVRDEQIARVNHYLERKEKVRAGSALEILRTLDERDFDDVMELSSMVTDVETRWMNRISADEHLIEEFWGDWKILEDIECDEHAEVPERWKAERRAAAQREIVRGNESWRDHGLPNIRKFDPSYTANHDLLREPRHRRKVPIGDGAFERRIVGHKRYLGV